MADKKIVCDLNGITRPQFREYINKRAALIDELGQPGLWDENRETLDRFDWDNLYARVLVEWPYGAVTWEAYAALGMLDAKAVDEAVSDYMEALAKKN